jgi:hypothetical protein
MQSIWLSIDELAAGNQIAAINALHWIKDTHACSDLVLLFKLFKIFTPLKQSVKFDFSVDIDAPIFSAKHLKTSNCFVVWDFKH